MITPGRLTKTGIFRFSAITIVVLAMLVPAAGNARRKKKKPNFNIEVIDRLTKMNVVTSGLDSLISISGFDKPLNSGYETFFTANKSDKPLIKLWLTISYTTVGGQQLHARTEEIKTDIPAGETRQLSIRSFDRQKSFYYHKSRKPRSNDGVAPFKIALSVDSAAFAL